MQQLTQILYRCSPKGGAVGRITWAPEQLSEVTDSWQRWLSSCFQPILLPHLISGFQTAQAQELRELCRAAIELDARLSPVERFRSLNAGEALLFQKPPRGDRIQGRFVAEVRLGTVPGHFATLFALRAAGFSVPLRTAVLAYLMQELISGGCPDNLIDTALGSAIPAVNAAFGGHQARAGGGVSRYG